MIIPGDGLKLYDLLKDFELEDQDTRDRQLKLWKKLEFYWRSYQYLFWSDVANDWRTPELDPEEFENRNDLFYTKVFNLYKAHGESIIAALSTGVPSVQFFPDDAENSDDIETAKAYSQIAELVQRHNKSKLLLVQAIYTLFNQGFVAAYTYEHEDESYGTVSVPEYEDVDEKSCPSCGFKFGAEQAPSSFTSEDDITQCPQCGSLVQPQIVQFRSIVGYSDEPKSRQIIEIYGPINVRLPHWCRNSSQIPYLCLMQDKHYSQAKAEYPNIADEIGPGEDIDFMERWARLPVEAESSNSKGLVVVKKVWFRPSSYFAIKDDEFRKLLFDECPDGCEAHFVNGVFAKAENKNLDDCWTISFDPRSQHIHADPTGKVLIPVQDVFNEVYNLTVQTIESGIPETFADPEVLDFDKYNKTEKAPGQIYPAKPRPGETVDKAFTTIKTATVSQEIEKLASKLEQLAQFLVGSFPSIYGGQMTGSRTAAEYSMSRQQALQRLSTVWTIVTQFWSELMSKTVVQYANGIQEDEKFVKPQGNGFVNVWIRKASLTGKVGHVEPDTSEQFPISWSQKRDILLDLLQLGIPEINAVLFHPENAQLVADLNGLGGLKIPGTNDRNKQYAEIDQLLVSQPMPNAEGAIQSSVPIDLELDDHAVHVQICKSFLSSERGQGIKVQNPAGYANVMSHLQAHQIAIQQLTMQPHEQSAAGEVPNTAALSTGV